MSFYSNSSVECHRKEEEKKREREKGNTIWNKEKEKIENWNFHGWKMPTFVISNLLTSCAKRLKT